MNSYYVRIHIIFAVIMYEFIYFLQCKIKAANACEPRARAASVQREPRGQSPSSPPAPTRPRPAAPTIKVACGSSVVGCLDMYRTKVLLYCTMVLLARPTKVRR